MADRNRSPSRDDVKKAGGLGPGAGPAGNLRLAARCENAGPATTAHGAVFAKNRQMLWHAMRAVLTLPDAGDT